MWIVVNLAEQQLTLYNAEGAVLQTYPVSTALRGAGEQKGSNQTPRGRHVIRAKVGADQPTGAVFRGRRFTGEIATEQLIKSAPERDWILTRILWLSGCQPGVNRLGDCDSMARYIYIHGTPDQEPMGVPRSHGCIRMRNVDVESLFAQVEVGCEVLILESAAAAQASRLVCVPERQARLLFQQFFPTSRPVSHAFAPSGCAVLLWDMQGELQALARLAAEGRITHLYVQPAFREQGLARRLIDAACAEGRRRGWCELRLTLPVATARQLTGFTAVGDPYLQDGALLQTWRTFL